MNPQETLPAVPSSKGRTMAIVGMVLNLAPVLGKVVTIVMILGSFVMLRNESDRNPEALAGSISEALFVHMVFLGIGVLGVVLVCLSLLKARLRQRWFFVYGIIAASLWILLAFPIGLIPGIVLLVLFLMKRPEFYPAREKPPVSIEE